MDPEERIELLEEARQNIYDAVQMIRDALRGTRLSGGAESYVIPSLSMCAGKEHEWLGNQPYNIDEMIEALQGNENH